MIEGLIAERSGILDNMRVGRRMDHILHHDAGQWETLAAVPAANILDNEVFDRVPFADLDVDDDLLNRHSILHGATAGFGTRLNALRTFFLLVATVEILDGAIVLRTDAAPPEMARCWMSTEHLPSSEQPRGVDQRGALGSPGGPPGDLATGRPSEQRRDLTNGASPPIH